MREKYPRYEEYVAAIFARVNAKPRIIEEHDGWSGLFSAVGGGAGVAISSDGFGYFFGDDVKLLRLTPEPKRISIGIITHKGKLSPAAEKFCQCAKEAFSALR
jgi:DNA-binding transcriptional LysR family regulator